MTQNEALTILKTGANVFLTGEPGSGKTHTVNAYIAWLRSHGIEPAITASTGIAATHVGGMTIHSWSGIGINSSMTPELLDTIASKEHVAKRLQKAKVLIIDEVSMLSGEVLVMVDAVLKEVRHSDLPMGGLQTVLVGDFFQLPPISRGETVFAFQSPAWKSLNPLICYLTEQHRQEDYVVVNGITHTFQLSRLVRRSLIRLRLILRDCLPTTLTLIASMTRSLPPSRRKQRCFL